MGLPDHHSKALLLNGEFTVFRNSSLPRQTGFALAKVTNPVRGQFASIEGGGPATESVAGDERSGKIVIGGMGERFNPAVLKTVELERVPGVRIPLPPPDHYAGVD